jgi:hypothetical protein
MVRVVVMVHGYADLAKIVGAPDSVRRLADPLDRWNQQAEEQVAGGLEQALAAHHPLTMGVILALADMTKESESPQVGGTWADS